MEAVLGLSLEETRIYREAKAQGRKEGRQEEGLEIVLRLLRRRFSTVDSSIQEQIRQLSSTQLADLSEALLDFSTKEDLAAWLQAYPPA